MAGAPLGVALAERKQFTLQKNEALADLHVLAVECGPSTSMAIVRGAD